MGQVVEFKNRAQLAQADYLARIVAAYNKRLAVLKAGIKACDEAIAAGVTHGGLVVLHREHLGTCLVHHEAFGKSLHELHGASVQVAGETR